MLEAASRTLLKLKIASDNQQNRCVMFVPLFYLLLRIYLRGNLEMFPVVVDIVSLLGWSQIKYKHAFQIDMGLIFGILVTLSSALPTLH